MKFVYGIVNYNINLLTCKPASSDVRSVTSEIEYNVCNKHKYEMKYVRYL